MIKSLVKRRVPQIVGIYLGGCWIAVEFVNFLEARFLLSETLTDFVLVALLAMLPTVIVIAWFHGTPGKDRWQTTEKVVVPINLLVTAALLVIVFSGEEIGAATTRLTAIDEQGETVTRIAPRHSFRRRVAVFFFDNESGDAGLDWLQHGINIMLMRDLGQDPFVVSWSPYDGFEQSGFFALRRAGYADGLHAPLPLLRQVARQFDFEQFVTGHFSRQGGEFVIDAFVHPSAGSGEAIRIGGRGADPTSAVDVLTLELKDALEVPAGSTRLTPDLPVREHFSGSLDAIRDYVAGVNAETLDNDEERAIEAWQAAGRTDTSFAAAQLEAALLAVNSGRMDMAAPAAAAARIHEYKLLPDERFVLKAVDYVLQDQFDKVVSVYEMWSELYPDDARAQTQLAFAYMYHANDIDKALATLRNIHEQDPNESWVLRQIAALLTTKGDVDGAQTMLEAYSRERPEDARAMSSLGRLHRYLGDLEEAREHFERAELVATGLVEPLLDLADLDLREGRYDDALTRIAAANGIATVPRQRSAVLRTEIAWYEQRGMMDELVERMNELYEVDGQYRGRINQIMIARIDFVDRYVLAGRGDFILGELEELEAELEPPIDALIDVGYLLYHLAEGNLEESEFHARRVERLIEQFDRNDLAYRNDLAQAGIHEMKGDLAGAVRAMESGLEKFSMSVQSIETSGDLVRICNDLGRYRRETGDLDGAQAALQKALDVYPAHPITNLEMARIAWQRGDLPAARQRLAQSLVAWSQADPDYRYAREARALEADLGPPADDAAQAVTAREAGVSR